jgi:predicted SprT family Zn-dependent metalloprotease
MYSGMLNRDDVESVINVVCWRLKINKPKVAWSGITRNGFYRCGTIHIGPKLWRGLDGVLHEVAHHVVAVWYCVTIKRRKVLPHGKEFQIALKAVAETWGEYNWESEYKRIAGKARKG